MHEYTIARDLVRRAVAEAKIQGDYQITALNLRLGPDAWVTQQALAFGLQAASQGTPAENCQVRITEISEGGLVLESIELAEASQCV